MHADAAEQIQISTATTPTNKDNFSFSRQIQKQISRKFLSWECAQKQKGKYSLFREQYSGSEWHSFVPLRCGLTDHLPINSHRVSHHGLVKLQIHPICLDSLEVAKVFLETSILCLSKEILPIISNEAETIFRIWANSSVKYQIR